MANFDFVETAEKGISNSLAQQSQVLPRRSNWASELGDKCLRRLVYLRTQWDKMTPPNQRLQGVFNTGRVVESETKQILNGIGSKAMPQWELVGSGVSLNDKLLNEHNIGGAPDTFIKLCEEGQKPRILGPGEIKSMDSNIYRRINTLEDFEYYKWMRKYKTQLTIYELASNFEMGWFILVNKSNLWDIKIIPLPLDLTFADTLLATAKEVNEYVRAEMLPDKLNDPDECLGCPFEHICLPEYERGKGIKVTDSDELAGVLDRLDELKEIGEEIDGLEKQKDELLIKGQDTICGNWMILWKKSIINHKAKEASVGEQWRKKIIKLK